MGGVARAKESLLLEEPYGLFASGEVGRGRGGPLFESASSFCFRFSLRSQIGQTAMHPPFFSDHHEAIICAAVGPSLFEIFPFE